MKKDKTKIPKGMYCYTYKNGKCIPCPYWSIKKDRAKQENGYCSFLGKGDWDLNKSSEIIDCKTKKIVKKKGMKSSFSWSLLWDMVKECGINEED